MQKQTITYTDTFKKALGYATVLSNSSKSVLSSDDIFWGCFVTLQKRRHGPLLRSLIGIRDLAAMKQYFKEHYGSIRDIKLQMTASEEELEQKTKLKNQEIRNRKLQENVQTTLSGCINDGITKIDIVTLLYSSFLNLSTEMVYWLEATVGDTHILYQNLEKLLSNGGITKVGIFAFLKKFGTMLNTYNLDINELPMIHIASEEEINDMMHNFSNENNDTDDNISSILNGYESDVLDRDDIDDSDDDTPTTTKKKKKKESDKKMTIEYFGTDLTQDAQSKHLDPCIGREKEIDQVIYTLLRKSKNNPLLIGEAGVGKTAIVEGLAQRIADGTVPEKLKNKKIYMLDMGTLVAGTKYRGEFESRFKAILEEAADVTNNIIMFIDEIHTIMGAGGAQGTDDASQLIKPLLARGKIKLIGATTFDEFHKHLEKDAALKRRFQEVHVDEPSLEATKQILLGLKPRYEDFHGVKIEESSLDTAITLSQRYILNKYLPDKAIDIIDEACARKSTMTDKLENDKDYKKALDEVRKTEKKIEGYIEAQDYFAAAEAKKDQEKLKEKMRHLRSNKNIPLHMRPSVVSVDVGQVLADKTGVPSDVVTESEIHKLKRLETDLKAKIIGQDEAVKAVVRTLQRNRLSVVERNKPISSFLFLGPSGVGKTYLAKLIAEDYFGDKKALVRVDMSEFMEKYSVSKLIGSAPGYVGHESGGVLTEAIRRKPYSVVLFDEIEKADPDVLNILLQILDEGQIKDSKGKFISFKSTIIIMTSNLGHEEFAKKVSTIGFATESGQNQINKDFEKKKERVMETVKGFMSPELLNRIDYKMIFRPLEKPVLADIFKLKLDDFLATWKANSKVELPSFTKKKINKIIEKIHDPQLGVRPLEKYIHEEVEPEIIDKLMEMDE